MINVLSTRMIGLWVFKIFKTITLKELDIVTPFFSDVTILDRGTLSFYLAKLANSTDVSLITMPPKTQKQDELLSRLNKKGIKIFLNPRLHAKLVLAKYSPVTGYALMGSANLTFGGLCRNIELAVITDNRKLIRDLDQEVRKTKITSKSYINTYHAYKS